MMTVDWDQPMANMPNALAVFPPAAMRKGFWVEYAAIV